MNLLLRIYDFLHSRRQWLWTAFTALLIPLIVLAVSLRYNENILDFLPLDEQDREALTAFQAQESASSIILIVEGDSLREEAIEACAELLSDLQTEIDPTQQMAALYKQLPYFISDSTYACLDSLCSPEAVKSALERDKMILSTPGAGILATAIQYDPLALIQISNITLPTSNFQLPTSNFQHPTRSYAFLSSPYGSTETKHNAALADSLNAVAQTLTQQFPHLNIRWIGAPLIAVGNANRIKLDSLICIALSLVFIIALLLYAFPRKRDWLLILLAVSFGWLVGMAVLRLVTPTVSAMVIGIGSILIGIAVNYPLHLLVHQRYTTSVHQTLKEVLEPLVIGNITTVGAFLALIPLKATAMRHLGIFAAAMLVGTILFCIFILPHLMSAKPTPLREIKLPTQTTIQRSRSFEQSEIRNHKPHITNHTSIIITLLLALFLLFSYLSDKVSWLPDIHRSTFNAELSSLNYMTPQQRSDIAFFDSIANPFRQMTEQQDKAKAWNDYWQKHNPDSLIATIDCEAATLGFKPGAFTPFYHTLTDWKPAKHFDINKITQSLSDNFEYLGLVCSLIVFIFLWLSFRKFSIALIAFLPMALSWVWIFAIMQIFGLQFNIVNIILATLIFGQGDDYTIFIVEGLLYERKTGQTILPQYRQSIILSALIMLFAIGSLVFAVHPAMHSLGVVTLIGMSAVLLMAFTIPPFLFRFIK